MDLLAVTIELTDYHLKLAGTALAAVAVVFLAMKHFGSIKSMFSGWYLPSIASHSDCRVSAIHCLDELWTHLPDIPADKRATVEDILWPEIRKAGK